MKHTITSLIKHLSLDKKSPFLIAPIQKEPRQESLLNKYKCILGNEGAVGENGGEKNRRINVREKARGLWRGGYRPSSKWHYECRLLIEQKHAVCCSAQSAGSCSTVRFVCHYTTSTQGPVRSLICLTCSSRFSPTDLKYS